MANVTKDSKTKGNFKKRKAKVRKPAKDEKFTRSGESETPDMHPKCNDVDWYTVSDQLLRDAGSLSFNNPLGNSLRVTELSQFDSSITYTRPDRLDNSIPGVIALHYIPTIGYSEDSFSAINVAAKGLYSAVRADNSGAKNYDPADMMKYLMAVDSAYSLWSYMARAYGIARVYSVVNRYWPTAILEAMHINANDLFAHLADLRYYLNMYAVKLNALCAPSSMPIFKRHFWMNSGIWKDAKNDKGQLYLFIPDYLYRYDETSTPAKLAATNIIGDNNTRLTVSDIISNMETIINPLLASEDVGIISGDLFKRYGMSGSFKLASVNEDYEVYPVFSPEILSQIQNIRFVGIPIQQSVDIIELTTDDGNAGALHQVLNVQSGEICQNIAHPLNLDEDLADTSPQSVMIASRLTAMGSVVKSEDGLFGYQAVIDVCGSEVCTTWDMYRIIGGDIINLFSEYNKCTSISVRETNVPVANASSEVALCIVNALSAFNYHPLLLSNVKAGYTEGKLTTLSWQNCMNTYDFDFDNYTIVGKTALRKLHESALLAEFNVPAMGQYQ